MQILLDVLVKIRVVVQNLIIAFYHAQFYAASNSRPRTQNRSRMIVLTSRPLLK